MNILNPSTQEGLPPVITPDFLPLADTTCVSCGQCSLYCPTGAIHGAFLLHVYCRAATCTPEQKRPSATSRRSKQRAWSVRAGRLSSVDDRQRLISSPLDKTRAWLQHRVHLLLHVSP